MIKFNLDIPRSGYVILVKRIERDFIGNQIEKAQLRRGFKPEEACYIHCTISMGGPYIIEVSPPRTKVVDIRKKYKGRFIRIVRYKDEKGEYENHRRYKITIWSATQCNLKYDWFGVLAFRFRIFWQWASRPFCAENCLWAHKKEYQYVWGVLKPAKCMPAHFYGGAYFEKVWEGIVE